MLCAWLIAFIISGFSGVDKRKKGQFAMENDYAIIMLK